MSYRSLSYFRRALAIAFLVVLAIGVPSVWAQGGAQGMVALTVMDSSGGVIPGASLELIDLSTNDTRKTTTRENGTYVFVNLNIGKYKVKVEHQGFSAQAIDPVVVHAALTTDLTVTLKVGMQTEVMEVHGGAVAPLETTSNVIGTVVDMKQIEDLPLIGRDLTNMARITAGYAGDAGGEGSWNGQPLLSQGSNVDGTMGSASRMKMFGNMEPAVAPRIEAIAEMTVQTDQLDLDQGFGESVSQANFVTRRGTNAFHGRVFDNFHNDGLNANRWIDDFTHQRKAKSIYNRLWRSDRRLHHQEQAVLFRQLRRARCSGRWHRQSIFRYAGHAERNLQIHGYDRHTANREPAEYRP
jgi:hypothetical protein